VKRRPQPPLQPASTSAPDRAKHSGLGPPWHPIDVVELHQHPHRRRHRRDRCRYDPLPESRAARVVGRNHPGNNESAGKVKSSRTRPDNPYLQGALGAYRGQSSDGIGQQEAFDEATKVPLLVMKGVRVEPCYTQSYQTGRQRDPFDSNQFEQVVNRRERVVGTGRNEDIVAFKDIQVWLCYLNQSQGRLVWNFIFPPLNGSYGS
jgi:hypothetical protein